jgi:SAM-dependent methyltransferase
MIKATDKGWDSATTLYVARRLQEIAGGQRIAVLDMGCGDGRILEYLLDYGYELYGYDLIHYEDQYDETRRKRLVPYFGDSYDEHIKVTESERAIPFDDDSFDVVYANQVFEHVRFFDKMIFECARVLKPGGILLANFPVATYPIEGHLKIPFAHWIPPGTPRVRYLQLCCALGLFRKKKGYSALETALDLDRYLREETYYRFMNEIMSVSKHYFEACELETDAFVRAKIDLLMAGKGTGGAKLGVFMQLIDGDKLHSCITHLLNAAFCMRNPIKDETIQGTGW